MQQQYELAIIYHPDLEVDIAAAEQKVAKIVTQNGGEITATDNWGKRKLAYIIKKQQHGIYVFYSAELPPTGVQKIESTLNITDEVIRFLITKPDLKAQAKAETARQEKAKKAAARGSVADDGEESNNAD